MTQTAQTVTTEQTTPAADLMTPEETIAYLRLDADSRDPQERLRNLIRFQNLPVRKRGRLRLFRRAEVDAWLNGERVGAKTKSPARMLGGK